MSRARSILGAAALACGSITAVAAEPTPAAPPPFLSSEVPCPPEIAAYEPHARPDIDADAHLPSVPVLPKQPSEIAGAYSIGGASHFLRTRVHAREVSGKRITLQGYIVRTNLADAPRCALHRAGRPDPRGCKAPVPAFWLGDTPDAAPSDSIKVMGWASSYAEIYEAIRRFDSGKENTRYVDSSWNVEIPNPLPSTRAHVRVSGTYSRIFTTSSAGFEANPQMGLLTYDTIEYLEPPPELGTLPGVKRRR